MVIVLYSNRGELKIIQVDWVRTYLSQHNLLQYSYNYDTMQVNVASVCGYSPIQYQLSIRYNDMEAVALSTAEVQSNECMPATCTAKIVIATKFLTSSLRIFLTASNSGGTSTHEFISPIRKFIIICIIALKRFMESIVYTHSDQSSSLYYRPSIMFLNCTALQINCFSSVSVQNNT